MLMCMALLGCSQSISVDGQLDGLPDIYPDYVGVTVPANIAPLNFHVNGDGEYALIVGSGDDSFTLRADNGDFTIPLKKWREALSRHLGDSLQLTVCRRDDGRWLAYKPFYMHVSADSIDRMLVYRLIPPLYGTWREIGIYQRDLESYDQTPIYENVAYHGNCVNCHSFCQRDPDNMLFHLRGPGGGTYLRRGVAKLRLDTKTDSTISNFTYPYWHPSGRYVAFSVNDIFQVFHNADPNRTEVIDDASDLVIYDIANNQAFSAPQIKSKSSLETFPAFSADGRKLFFCSAVKPDTLPERYADVHYSLCSVDFDADMRMIGSDVDTLLAAGAERSVSLPRPSPDGRWLAATVGGYGNFHIWHKDADLWLMDLRTGEWRPMDAANSPDVESYHSWSGNSRWMVFSSRRDDGYYTRPYIVHISADGIVGKPFMLPQLRPKKYYEDERNSFNIPELVSAPVGLNSRDVVDWIASPSLQVNY